MADVALGLRPHSGWAALVALAGPRETPTVVARARIELAGRGIPKQPYHAAENLVASEGAGAPRTLRAGIGPLASTGLRETARNSHGSGHEIVGRGARARLGPAAPRARAVLASHALIHTADGEHFRGALRKAAARGAGSARRGTREGDLGSSPPRSSAKTADRLGREIDAIGKSLGPPWTSDQKLAALARGWPAAGRPGINPAACAPYLRG